MSGNVGGNGVQQQTRAPQGLTMAMGERRGRQNGAIDCSRRRRPALLASAGRYRGVKIEFDAVKKERDERQKIISNWRTLVAEKQQTLTQMRKRRSAEEGEREIKVEGRAIEEENERL
ncbi:hypothetical protein niasHS_006838 [Heterodera schachtii]|uniref:Uncharacterized protein n=1 Tax=Heterodera schachtii TaxID=97005 RepID=A0ABD2JIF2_HETSC